MQHNRHEVSIIQKFDIVSEENIHELESVEFLFERTFFLEKMATKLHEFELATGYYLYT